MNLIKLFLILSTATSCIAITNEGFRTACDELKELESNLRSGALNVKAGQAHLEGIAKLYYEPQSRAIPLKPSNNYIRQTALRAGIKALQIEFKLDVIK